MSEVDKAWERITQWLRIHAPIVAERFTGPATEDDIAAVEEEVGWKFPGELRQSYLIHDGAEYGESELCIFPTHADSFDDMAFSLLPVKSIAAEWDVWRDLIDMGEFDDVGVKPDAGIEEVWWSRAWLPVAGNGGGDFICVDMQPTAQGLPGQVICAWHDSDERQLLAPSWGAYLSGLADDMDAGKVRFTEDYGIVANP